MSDGRLPYFNLYTGDMRKRTERMTPAARGHFLWLLMAQWDNGPLPDSLKQLRLISPGLTQSLWDEITPQFEAIEAGLVHLPLEALRSSAEQRKDTATTKARDAAIARWGKAERRKRRDAPSIATSNARSTKSACLEHCSEQCLGDAMSESSSESESPPTHSGGMGTGGDGDSPTEASQPGLALVRSLHRSACDARQRLVFVRGEQQGEEAFVRLIATRLQMATRKLVELGVDHEQAHHLAERTLTLWHWEQWYDTINAITSEAKGKQSPAGWVRWRIDQKNNTTNQAATA